jgi:hypothetical protein
LSSFKKKGHEEEKCWKLHLELKPKWANHRKGNKMTKTIVQDLGSDSEDEAKVTTMGIKHKSFVASFISCTSFAKTKVILDGMKRKELFHL